MCVAKQESDGMKCNFRGAGERKCGRSGINNAPLADGYPVH